MPDLPTPDELFGFLERQVPRLTRADARDFGPIGSRGRALAWNWSYWGRALVFAYRATRQPRFLDLFVAAFAEILAQRDDRLGLVDGPRGRVVPGWGTDLDGVHANELTVAGLVTLPLCEFLLTVGTGGAGSLAYGRLVPEYLAIAEAVVWPYELEYRESVRGGTYLNATTGRPEPLNHVHALAAAFAHLFALTGQSRYRDKVDAIAKFFEASVVREPNGSWSWPYVGSPGSWRQPPAEAIWKAGTTIEFPAASLRHGVAFGNAVGALSATLTRNILRPDGINEFVTSRRTSLLGPQSHGLSRAGAGFAIWFLMPDPTGSQRRALIEHMDREPALFPGPWLGGARGMVMAAAWLMNGERTDGR